MPECLSIESLRSWLAGELPSAERASANAHVARCSSCQSRLDGETEYTTLKGWLEADSGTHVEDVDLAIAERLLRGIIEIAPQPTSARSAVSAGTSSRARIPDPEHDIGRVGAYRLSAELGRGGMGIVYRAWDERLSRIVALKVLRAERAEASDRMRLVREARLAARFQNDNAVTIHSVVDPPDGLPYVVMEYVRGPTLAELIGSDRRPPPRELAALVAQVALSTLRMPRDWCTVM
jgi:hypothetical protein